MKKTFITSYLIILIGLFLYSFTQIDLSLTFSKITFLRNIINSFQYIGYFNRPLSAFLFTLIIIFLFNLYLGFLTLARTSQINKKTVWKLIILTTIILTFSYNAFSYDLFNYIFDAKIITHYHQNPYLHKALDFPGDPMLSFMHWTHRVYPYGPFWLILTVPLSFLGLNLFIPTFLLFKILIGFSFLGTAFFLGKILQKINPDNYLFGIIFFALNPLIMIESLVSGHLDIVMLFFAAWSFYQLISKKYLLALILLGVSIGIKFETAVLLPVYLIFYFLQIKKIKINLKLILYPALALMFYTMIYASQRTNFQPWYLLEPLFIAVLISENFIIFIPSLVFSLLALFNYAPFLYLGNWNPPVPGILSGLYNYSYIISIIAVAGYFFFKRKLKTQKAKNNKKTNI